MNARAWMIWKLLEQRWNIVGMAGVIAGWTGHEAALQMLVHAYGVKGEELIAEMERFRVLEVSQLEIEAKKYKLAEKERERKSAQKEIGGEEQVAGDLSDFYEDGEPPEDDT